MKLRGVSRALVVVVVLLMFGGGYVTYAATAAKQTAKTTVKYVAGPRGAAGPAGPIGPSGQNGLQGAIGLQGATGPRGLAGQNAPANSLLTGSTAGGDITGTFSNLTVSRIAGVRISLGGGATGDVLTQQPDGSYVPQVLPASSVPPTVFTSYAQSNFYNLSVDNTMQLDPVNLSYGRFDQSATLPALQYAASGQIMQFVYFTVQHVNTTHDQYDLEVDISISNESGSENLYLVCHAFASSATVDDTATVGQSDCFNAHQTGSDITYNPSDGTVDTTAGGLYSAQVNYFGTWD